MTTCLRNIILIVLLAALSCGQDPEPSIPQIQTDAGDAASSMSVDASNGDVAAAADMAMTDVGSAWPGPCTQEPCPIVIESFPFLDSRDTSTSVNRFDSYPACAPQDESGPEFAYVFRIDTPGTVVAGIVDPDGVDVDVHLLSDLDAQACLRRGDVGVSAHLEPGTYYLVVDSFVGAAGAGDGPYDLHVDFLPDTSPCAMVAAEIERIGADELLAMPATGRVVLEAHLVTAEEAGNFAQGWPTSFTDGIAEHYALSEAASGYAMDRMEPWAPCCEPTNEFGQGSSVLPPAIAEAWYLNMRWRSAPARGERYIVMNPATGRAVVAAAGYENGPGDTSRVGGVCEEIHDVLGTGHLSTLTVGVAADQTLPYGPIDCHR